MKHHLTSNLSHLTWLAHAYLHNVCCALYILKSDLKLNYLIYIRVKMYVTRTDIKNTTPILTLREFKMMNHSK